MKQFFIKVPESDKHNQWYKTNGLIVEVDDSKILTDEKETGQEFYHAPVTPVNDELIKHPGFKWAWVDNNFYKKGWLRINRRFIRPLEMSNREAVMAFLRRD